MEDIVSWMAANDDWLWWSVGIGLLIGEMLIPGVYLMWIGIAALTTGVLTWLVPGFEFGAQGVAFTVISVALIYGMHRFYYSRQKELGDNGVNRHGAHHVGKTYVVANAIENGRGHISVGDTRWLAEGPDAPVGARVRVEAIEGTVMKVVPL